MSENFIVFFLSFTFIAYIIICFIRGITGQQEFSPVSDNFKIGYIEREKPVVIEKIVYKDRQVKVRDKKQDSKIKSLERQLEILTKRLESKSNLEDKKEHPLYQDCVDAAVALGCKKKEAAQGVKKFFENNDVDSIEEFIVKYFKRG